MTSRTAFVFLTVLSILLVTLTAAAQERREIPPMRTYGESASAQADAAIQEFIKNYANSWYDLDASAFIAFVFIEHRLFPALDASATTEEVETIQPISLRYIGDDVAVIHMYTDSQQSAATDGGEDTRRVHFHLVLEYKAGAWKIVHTAIMDAR